ncbi:MAG: hypothetical protein RPR97_00160 [Colwellia sp.]|jgi:hypothetical protein
MVLQGVHNEQEVPSQKIPANDHDNYDDNDKIALLESWLTTEAEENKAIKYIDNHLKLELGSTKKSLSTIFYVLIFT